MSLDWGGSSSSGRSGGNSGGSWWNPITDLSKAYHAVNPVGGLWNLASGIAKSFIHPIYGTGLGLGQVIQGGGEELIGHPQAGWSKLQQAAGTFTDVAQKGVVGSLAGYGQGFANLGSDIATPLGVGGQYNKVAGAPFHQLAQWGGETGLGSETYHQLADFTPSTAQARGRKEGFLGSYGGDMLLAAGASDLVGNVAGKVGDFQSGAATGAEAAAAGGPDTGAIADGAAAEARTGPGSRAYKIQATAETLGHRLNWLSPGLRATGEAGSFIGLKTADLIKAFHQQAFPGEVAAPGATAPPATAPAIDAQVASYNAEHGLPAPGHVDPTQELNPELGAQRAHWYQNAESTPNAPEVKASYQSLANDVKAQFKYLTETLGVKVVADNGDIGAGRTYEDAAAMSRDVADNKTLHVTPTGPDEAHPQPEMNAVAGKDANGTPMTVNDMFRAVHDYFGHTRLQNGVGASGEDVAWQLHQQMFHPESIPALATETAGQNGYLNFSEGNQALKAQGLPAEFGPQKSALMPEDLRGPSPAEQAAARATLHPVDAAAEAMAANSENARGTSADTRVKIPTTTGDLGLTPPSEDVAQTIDQRVQEARDAHGPTTVEDRLGRILNTPAPAWATRMAEQLPDSVNRVLAHLNTPLTWARLRALQNDLNHYVEMAQNHERSSPMHIAAQNAIADLISTSTQAGETLTRDQLTHMVGEEVSARLDGAHMLIEFTRAEGKFAPPDVLAQMEAAAKRNYTGIPDAIWTTMDEATHARVDQALEQIMEQYKQGAAQRLETMLSSRYGAQGIERALMPDGEIPMTADQVRLYRRSMGDFIREAVLRTRDVAERDRLQARITKAALFAGKADQAVLDAQAKLGINEATISSLHDPIPPGVVDAAGTAQKMIEATLADGGATFDVGRGISRAAEGFIVGLHEQFTVPVADFQQRGVELLTGAIRTPVGADGTLYDPSALWSGPDATLGTWVHDGPDGTPVVTVDIGVASNRGVPLDELQARGLGEAYNQEAIYNPATGQDIMLSKNPTVQNLNALYVADMLDPKSNITRVMNEMAKARADGALNITAEEQYAELHHLMQMDHSLEQLAPDSWKRGTIFEKTKVEFAQKATDQPHLAQTVMRMTPDQLVEFAQSTRGLDHARISSSLAWYHDSNAYIESLYRGKNFPIPSADGTIRDAADVFYDVLAVTSVMASPTTNLGRALMAFSNTEEFLKAQTDGLAAAKSVMERAMANEPGGTTRVQDLGLPTERDLGTGARRGEGTSVAYRWLNTPEFRALTQSTSMTTVPKYNVIDILLGNFNLETATSRDVADQYVKWTGKQRGGGLSEANFPRAAVVSMADTLGLHGPGVQAYQDWVGRGDALHELGVTIKEMKAQGLGTKETLAKALADQGFKTQADLARAIKAHRAEEPALRADPEVTQAAEQALLEHHGSNALAKLRSFRDNLANPGTSLMVTLDSVMAQGFGLSKTDFGKGGKYAEFANAVRDTAARLSKDWGRTVMPHEVQALAWVTIKDYVGKQDWGRLLAHHDIAQNDVTALENAVSQGGVIDAKTFRPFRDYWQEENGLTTENQANVAERAYLRDLNKKEGLTDEEWAKLQYLEKEWVPRAESIVHTTPDRVTGEGDQGWLTANQTAETRIHIADDAKIWKEKTRQSEEYQKLERGWQKDIGAGNFDKVRREVTSYLNSRRNSILGDAEGEAFGSHMVKPGSSAATAIERLQGSRYVPQPSAEMLHSSAEGLMQQIHGDVKGVTMVDPDAAGRYLTKLYKTADLSTLLHEHAHLLRQILPEEVMAEVRQQYPGIEGRFRGFGKMLPERLRAPGRELVQVPESRGGNLNVQRVNAEEQFVTDLQRYMQDKVRGGQVPPGHELLFNRVASLLEDGHAAFLGTAEGRAVPNDIAEFWDRMFRPDTVRPDAMHDPLSAQYVRPPATVNVKQFNWESDAQFAKRARQYGEARGATPGIEREIAQAKARADRADAAVQRMHQTLLDGTPTSLAADALHTRALATLEKVATQLDNPTRAQLPPQWRNFMESLDGIREAAKADKTGGTAEILAEIPDTFSAAMRFAAERGFEPQYIPDMTWQQARRFMMGHLRLDGEATADSMRKVNEGVLSRTAIADRSMEALGAGFVKATRELYRGKLVDFVEQNYAKPIAHGETVPEGWTAWSPEKTAIITGRSVVGKGDVVVGDQYIVPDAVASALKSMRADYSNWAFRGLMKGAAPWKTLILTLSPTWYLKHFMGAVSLATAEGVKLQDWKTAWGQWKSKDLPEVARGRSIFSTLDDQGATVGTTFKRPTFGEGGTLSAEGKRIALKEVTNRMRGVVKSVDALGRAAVFAKTLREGGSYEYAVTRSYEALGDFGSLSPFERDAVQAVIPFYAFQKAMLRVLMHVASDHPLATGVLMQIGRMHNAYLGAQLGGLPTGLIGAGIVGGDGHKSLVGYQKLNPLTDSWQLLTPEGIAASLNPVVQLFARQAFHYQSFNDRAGMGSYGQLVPQQNTAAAIGDIFGSSPVGGLLSGGKGFNILNPSRVYTPDQVAALRKRLAKTLKAEDLVNAQGGYLATDANPPTKKTG